MLVDRMSRIRGDERREVARGRIQLLNERGDARVIRAGRDGEAIEEAEGQVLRAGHL